MKITIAGGTGFLGRGLEKHFQTNGHEVNILSRNPKRRNEHFWDGSYLEPNNNLVSQCEVLINLSGKSVDCRYTAENKKEILQSRIDPTLAIHSCLKNNHSRPRIWINASSATCYIHAETTAMTEAKGILGDDFSMNICKSWESAFFSESHQDIRQVAIRSSIVLGNKGGALPKLKIAAKLGLGGKHGRGNQMVSWIHIGDFCRAIDHIINSDIEGPINITAPNPKTNEAFMKEIRKRYGIHFGLDQPAFLLEAGAVIIGTETELLLKSRYVIPERLQNSGFQFLYPHLDLALAAL